MNNKEIQKKRMLTYFIESAQQIMDQDGVSGVTLRKVAEGAGYNMATLYNYFEDLDHVILYASLKYLSKYNYEVKENLKKCTTSQERFYVTWDTFCRISACYPEAFHQIFFNKHSASLYNIYNKYYELFPEESTPATDTMYSILTDYQLSNRSRLVLIPLLKETHHTEEHVDIINDLIVSAYHYLLHECKNQSEHQPMTANEFSSRMRQYLDYLIRES